MCHLETQLMTIKVIDPASQKSAEAPDPFLASVEQKSETGSLSGRTVDGAVVASKGGIPLIRRGDISVRARVSNLK
jgi:hypothetical protein